MSNYQDRINQYVGGLSSQSNAFDMAMGNAKEAAQNALIDKLGAHADYMANVGGIVSGASLASHGAYKGVKNLHKAIQGYRSRKQAKLTGGNEPETVSPNAPQRTARLQEQQAAERSPAKAPEDTTAEDALDRSESKRGIRQNLGKEDAPPEAQDPPAKKPLFSPDEDEPILSPEESGKVAQQGTTEDILSKGVPNELEEQGGKLVPTDLGKVAQTARQQGLDGLSSGEDNPFSFKNLSGGDSGGGAAASGAEGGTGGAQSTAQRVAQLSKASDAPGSGPASSLLADIQPKAPAAPVAQAAKAAPKTEFDAPDLEGDLLTNLKASAGVKAPQLPNNPISVEDNAFSMRPKPEVGIGDLFKVGEGDSASSLRPSAQIASSVQDAVTQKTSQLGSQVSDLRTGASQLAEQVQNQALNPVRNALGMGADQTLKDGAETMVKQVGEKIGGSILGEGATAVAGAAAEFVPVVGELAGIGMLIKGLVTAHKEKTEGEENPPQVQSLQETAGGFNASAMLHSAQSGVASLA